MVKRGVDPFWADAAMRYIGRAMSTNSYFTKGVSHFKLTFQKHFSGVPRIFSFDVLVYYPDKDKEVSARLTYSFSPVQGTHKVRTKVYSDKTSA